MNTLTEQNLFVGTGYIVFYFNMKKKNYSAVTLLQCGKKITFKGISQFKKMGVSNEGKNGGLETEEANVM